MSAPSTAGMVGRGMAMHMVPVRIKMMGLGDDPVAFLENCDWVAVRPTLREGFCGVNGLIVRDGKPGMGRRRW